jgi:hypothetical protein
MARSLRRVKKNRPKIIKRKKKTPFAKSKLPVEIKQDSKTIEAKLGSEWYVGGRHACDAPGTPLAVSHSPHAPPTRMLQDRGMGPIQAFQGQL